MAASGPVRDARADGLRRAGFEILPVADAGEPQAGSAVRYAASAEAVATAAAEVIDRLNVAGFAAPLAVYGIGIGVPAAARLAFSAPAIAALVLEDPPQLVGRLQRILLHRERLRLGSDMPSRTMRGAGAWSVGNWLAIAAMQRALPSLPNGERRASPALIVRRQGDDEGFLDFLRSRGAADAEAMEAEEGEAMPQAVIAWLKARLV